MNATAQVVKLVSHVIFREQRGEVAAKLYDLPRAFFYQSTKSVKVFATNARWPTRSQGSAGSGQEFQPSHTSIPQLLYSSQPDLLDAEFDRWQ